MNEDKLSQLELEVQRLRNIIDKFVYTDRYEFSRNIEHKGNRLAFFDVDSIKQWDSGLGRQDVSSVGSGPVYVDTKFTGNVGSLGYSQGDVVAALKAYGLLKT